MNCYPFIEAEKAQQRNVKRACELLKVSRAAYYAARDGQPCDRDRQDADLVGASESFPRDRDGPVQTGLQVREERRRVGEEIHAAERALRRGNGLLGRAPGHGRRGGCRPEGVVLAFGAFGKAGQAAPLTQRSNAVAPPGQYLVRIGLVPDVPDQFIARSVEDVVQRNREFNNAQARPKMASSHRDGVDGFSP